MSQPDDKEPVDTAEQGNSTFDIVLPSRSVEKKTASLGLEKPLLNSGSSSEENSSNSSTARVSGTSPDEKTSNKGFLHATGTTRADGTGTTLIEAEAPFADSTPMDSRMHAALTSSQVNGDLVADKFLASTSRNGGKLEVRKASTEEDKSGKISDASALEDVEVTRPEKPKGSWLTSFGTVVALTCLAFLFWRQCILGALRLCESRNIMKSQGDAQDDYAVMPTLSGKPYLSV